MIDPVVKVVELTCSAEQAFEAFVNRATSWRPKGKHWR